MQTLELLNQTNDYNLWANRAFLEFLKENQNSSQKAVKVFAHEPVGTACGSGRSFPAIETARYRRRFRL